jgi:DNA-binding CsgD family transcriptional regulator
MLALALIATDQRDLPRARELLSESIRLSRRLGNPHRVAQCLERVAAFAARSGHAEAWRFVEAAASIRADLAAPLSPIEGRLLAERLPAGHRPSEPDSTWSLERACDMAVELLTSAATEPGPAPREVRPRLTPREIEVAELVARGYSNREIAQTLTIAERTATSHLEHVLNKLGFHSRSQIATWVTERRRVGN